MTSLRHQEGWQEPFLRRVYASCLLAPLAAWYPPSANARGSAERDGEGDHAVDRDSKGLNQPRCFPARVERIRRLAEALLQQPAVSGEVQQLGAAADGAEVSELTEKASQEATGLQHSVLCGPSTPDSQLKVNDVSAIPD